MTSSKAGFKESTRLLILTSKYLVKVSGLSRLCLSVGQVQNGRRTSKNSKFFLTLQSISRKKTSIGFRQL